MSWQEHLSTGTLALVRADYPKAEVELKYALQAAEQRFSPDDERVRRIMALVGLACLKQSDLESAQSLLARSVESGRRSHCSNDLSNAMTLLSLAQIKTTTGDAAGANYRYQQAVELLRLPPADDEVSLRLQLKNIDRLWAAAQKRERDESAAEFARLLETAKAKHKQAKEKKEKAATELLEKWAHDLRAGEQLIEAGDGDTLSNGAEANYIKAYNLAWEAATIAYRLFAADDTKTARTLTLLATCSQHLKLHDQAEKLFQKACTIYDISSAACETRRSARLRLADLYSEIHAHAQALHCLLESAELAQDDSSHEEALSAQLNSSILSTMVRCELYKTFRETIKEAIELEESGRLEHASLLYERALALLRRTCPGDHPEIAQALRFKANLLRKLKQPGPAQQTDANAERIERIEQAQKERLIALSEQVRPFHIPEPSSR